MSRPAAGRAAIETEVQPFRVLFVCTGNTSRSPFLEVLACALAADAGCEGAVEFASAGTHARSGEPLDPLMRGAYAVRGLPLPSRWSRPLTRAECAAADLILTVEWRHRQWVRELDPEAAERVWLLSDWAAGDREDSPGRLPPGIEIPDPYGLDEAAADAAADLMESLLRQTMARLLGR